MDYSSKCFLVKHAAFKRETHCEFVYCPSLYFRDSACTPFISMLFLLQIGVLANASPGSKFPAPNTPPLPEVYSTYFLTCIVIPYSCLHVSSRCRFLSAPLTPPPLLLCRLKQTLIMILQNVIKKKKNRDKTEDEHGLIHADL